MTKPIEGGSYIRRPDGTLERVPPARPEPAGPPESPPSPAQPARDGRRLRRDHA